MNSDRLKLCPSCGQDTHSRSSSRLCPYKKQKEVTHEDGETTETYAIKCSLRKICNDRRLVHSITSMTSYTTKVMYIRLQEAERAPFCCNAESKQLQIITGTSPHMFKLERTSGSYEKAHRT
jgi:hypothetical protein